MQRNDTVALQFKFLRQTYTLRENNDNRPVVGIDETCVTGIIHAHLHGKTKLNQMI